jgi:hypothetical protein
VTVNVALNASDAMPAGGAFQFASERIELNVAAGRTTTRCAYQT